MAKTVIVQLAFESQEPVNFKFGEDNIRVSPTPSEIEDRFASMIIEQYPGWIQILEKPAKVKASKAIKNDDSIIQEAD